jgi:hypothetical protein
MRQDLCTLFERAEEGLGRYTLNDTLPDQKYRLDMTTLSYVSIPDYD